MRYSSSFKNNNNNLQFIFVWIITSDEAVVKHHDKVNIQCEWIVEVDLAKDNFSTVKK